MGTGYQFICRRCGYRIEAGMGVGFMFPVAYQEIVKTAKTGKLGEDLQQFLEEHPEGALDCGTVLLQCKECGCLKTGPDLSMYLPKSADIRPSTGNWSVVNECDGYEYVAPWELKANYRLFRHYQYRCHKCGAKMRTIRENTLIKMLEKTKYQDPIEELCCPECEKALEFAGEIMWD